MKITACLESLTTLLYKRRSIYSFLIFSLLYSSAILLRAQGSAGGNYCASRTNSTLHGYINKVSIESINNTSGNNNGYGKYTKLSALLQKGADYSIELTPGFLNTPGGGIYTEYWSVYIDFNQDGVFESNELIAHGNAAIRVIKSLNIPKTALNGQTRMRIQMQPGAEQTNPCAIYAYGEVEDYTVDIVNSIAAKETAKENTAVATDAPAESVNTMKLFPNPARDNLTVQMTCNGNGPIEINIYNQLGQKIIVSQHVSDPGKNTFTVNTAKLPAGFYLVEAGNEQGMQRQRVVIVR